MKVLAAELDSRKLPSGDLAYQRRCELKTLRMVNSYSRVGAPSRHGTYNGESLQAGIYVSHPVRETTRGTNTRGEPTL